MPLIRRLPKRGFNSAAFHKNYAIVNLSDLSAFKEGTVVNEQLLRESNLIRGNGAGLKILGGGELKHGLKIETDQISASAREKIEKAGGTVTMRRKPAPHGPRVAAQEPSPVTDASESKAKAATKKPSSRKKKPAKVASKKKSSGKS
jgi:large subunit ribosomal protein L15